MTLEVRKTLADKSIAPWRQKCHEGLQVALYHLQQGDATSLPPAPLPFPSYLHAPRSPGMVPAMLHCHLGATQVLFPILGLQLWIPADRKGTEAKALISWGSPVTTSSYAKQKADIYTQFLSSLVVLSNDSDHGSGTACAGYLHRGIRLHAWGNAGSLWYRGTCQRTSRRPWPCSCLRKPPACLWDSVMMQTTSCMELWPSWQGKLQVLSFRRKNCAWGSWRMVKGCTAEPDLTVSAFKSPALFQNVTSAIRISITKEYWWAQASICQCQ